MEKKLIFDRSVPFYAVRRPTYPDALVREVLDFSGAKPGELAIEVGAGTGIATQPMLDAGLKVVAYEPGENLANYCRERFDGRALTVKQAVFEDCDEPDGSAALVYSATAFHWCDPVRGYAQAMRVLRPGGTLALFWNRPFLGRRDDPTHMAIQKAYAEWYPSDKVASELDQARYQKRREQIIEHGFELREFKLFYGTRTMSAKEYCELLLTYSDHLALPEERQNGLLSGVFDAIERHGGSVTVYDTFDLHLATKPKD